MHLLLTRELLLGTRLAPSLSASVWMAELSISPILDEFGGLIPWLWDTESFCWSEVLSPKFLRGENGDACVYCHLPHPEKTPKLDKRQRTIVQGRTLEVCLRPDQTWDTLKELSNQTSSRPVRTWFWVRSVGDGNLEDSFQIAQKQLKLAGWVKRTGLERPELLALIYFFCKAKAKPSRFWMIFGFFCGVTLILTFKKYLFIKTYAVCPNSLAAHLLGCLEGSTNSKFGGPHAATNTCWKKKLARWLTVCIVYICLHAREDAMSAMGDVTTSRPRKLGLPTKRQRSCNS